MGPKVLAGANAYIKRVKRTNLARKMCVKFLKGVWGKLLSRSFPQKKYVNEAYVPKALSVTLSRATSLYTREPFVVTRLRVAVRVMR